jgi:hypothetical protein
VKLIRQESSEARQRASHARLTRVSRAAHGTRCLFHVGQPACDIGQLRQDLERFVFLLGSSDGEQLFGP